MKTKFKFTWTPKFVEVAHIKPTPKNYKIKNELGLQRLQATLASFGLAGTVVVNTDLTLIDGNSRLQEAKGAGEKKIWVSIPDRKLSPKEFKEFSAMFDAAKAGDVDMDSILGDLGSSKQFTDRFKLQIPPDLLEKMGKKARVDVDDIKISEDEAAAPTGQFRMVQLFFTPKQETEFRKWEEKFAKKFKTDNTTDTIYKALKSIA